MKHYFRFITNNRTLLGFGFLAVFWGNYGHSFFVAWFGASIQEALSLSAAEYGSAYFFANIASAASIVWAGALLDKVSLKKYCTALAFGLAGAALIMAMSWNFVSLCVGLYLLRLFGQALLPHAGITTMSRHFELDRGKAISIAGCGVPIGEIILPLIAVFFIAHFGWRVTFLAIAISSLVFFLPASRFLLWKSEESFLKRDAHLEDTVETSSKKVPSDATAKHMLLDKRYWMSVPAMSLPAFIVTGILIQQAFILKEMEWSTVWFAVCFVAYGGAHWISSLLAGVCVDRFSALKILPFYLLPLIITQFVLAFGRGELVALLVMLLLGITMGANQPVSTSFWAEAYGTKNLGAIRSVNVSVRVFIGSLSPVIFGLAIDSGWALTSLFCWSGIYCVFANILLSIAYSRRRSVA